MSKIEQMIEELCPDGVEYRKLGEVCQIKTGKGITQKDCVENGTYPVISGGVTPMGFYSEYNREAKNVTISRVGVNAGYVDFIETPFYVNDKCFSVIPVENQIINTKYLFYILKTMEPELMRMQGKSGVPTINVQKAGSLEVPLPPLAIQEEIVRILDKFTQLEAELEAELDCRKRQYEYYRDKLLSFDALGGASQVRWMKMSEICKVLRGKRLTKRDLSGNGTFPVFHGGLTPIGYYTSSNRLANSVMIIDVGASAGTIGYSDRAFWSSDGCFCLSHEDNIISQKYLYYYLQSIEVSIKGKVRTAGIPTLDNKDVERLIIPVPPLEEQQRIADILDRFEALTTDISQGLPAEIRARRQQYEYYRDKLLTFNRKLA